MRPHGHAVVSSIIECRAICFWEQRVDLKAPVTALASRGRQYRSISDRPRKLAKATWVEPTFVADVEYRDITSEGLLRASSFKGLSRK
jgi:hypothetical protein